VVPRRRSSFLSSVLFLYGELEGILFFLGPGEALWSMSAFADVDGVVLCRRAHATETFAQLQIAKSL
jgi:hypothetical protein